MIDEGKKSMDYKPIDPRLVQEPRNYFRVYREEVSRLVNQGSQVDDIVNYSESNITQLIKTLEQQKNSARRLRNWLYATGGAAVVVLALGLGGYYYGSSKMSQDYDNAVAKNVKLLGERDKLQKSVKELKEQLDADADVAKIKELEGVIGQKDETITKYEVDIMKKLEELESAQ